MDRITIQYPLLHFSFLVILFLFYNSHSGVVKVQYSGLIVEDSRICSPSPDFNGGDDGWGNVTYFSSNDRIDRTYIKIPIPDIIDTTTIKSIKYAELNIYITGLQSEQFGISIHEVLEEWFEYQINWNNKPTHTTGAMDSIILMDKDTWVSYDITDNFIKWVRNEKPYHGMVMKSYIEGYPIQNSITLASSDHEEIPKRPILEISNPLLPDTLISDLATHINGSGNKQKKNNQPVTFSFIQEGTRTNILYKVNKDDMVKIDVYDLRGKMIQSLTNTYHSSGSYTVTLNENKLANKIYFLKVRVGHRDMKGNKFIVKK